MANQSLLSTLGISLVLALVISAFPTGVQSIGVCYGMLGNNLPSPADVVSLYKSKKIAAMRLYAPNQAAFQALKRSNIQLILDVPRTDLQSLASSQSAATSWVKNNVLGYWPGVSFKYIAVGNEVIPGNLAQYVLPAMRNVQKAITDAGLKNKIKVSTAVSTAVIGKTYPPSAGAFSSAAQSSLNSIVQFLASNEAPLLVNVYPYFSYISTPGMKMDIKYALFTSSGTVVTDGKYKYQNLFDAMVDTVYAALEKVGGWNVPIVVSESGWPSAGGKATSFSNAQTYNQNLIKHVGKGTPRRPGIGIEAYIFAMFNENWKSPGLEQNWGLFYPNKQPVYPITFKK